MPEKIGPNGFYWGGLGTGGGRPIARLQPINRRGRRTTATTGPRGLVFVDAHDVLNLLQQFKRVQGARYSADSFALAANRKTAIALQELMVKMRQQGRVQSRRNVSTHRLDTALTNEQNRFVSSTQWGVGVPGYLNKAAPYWRAIEEGTAYFVGRKIYGIWGESLTGEYGGGGRYGAYPLAGGPYTGFGANRSGRLLPLGGIKALGLQGQRRGYQGRTAGLVRSGTGRSQRGTIKRPIQAQNYMRRAWRQFDPRKVGFQMAQEQVDILIASFGLTGKGRFPGNRRSSF